MGSGNPEISIVVPMYNESECLNVFFSSLVPILEKCTKSYEIVCINDGSSDDTLERLLLQHADNKNVKIIDLSRNFGKEQALTAGLDLCSGQAVIPMDADLQDPPELIPKLMERWREGFDVVLAVRDDRSTDGFLKRFSASCFYATISRLSETPVPSNAGDFRLMDRRVVEALKTLTERTRFMKGIFGWLGFRQTIVTYKREKRAAGAAKWKPLQLWNFALEGIVSFSMTPLKIWTYAGGVVALFAIGYMMLTITRTLIYGVDVPGYASLLSVVLFFSGMNMIGLGILGEYLGRVFLEVKQRPIYLVRSRYGFEQDDDGNASE